jgi:capsular exopolysaccharide synthesis family protein
MDVTSLRGRIEESSVSVPSQEQVTLLTDFESETAYSAAYHTLYANIRFNWESEQIKQHTILITAPTTTPRQSEVVANVAIAAAQNGTPTIVVDANFRTPSLQQRFSVGECKGLTDLLTGPVLPPQAIASSLCTTFIPDLRLLCAGKTPLQASRILLSEKLRDVLASLRQFLAETETKPSMIIFNSPPVLSGIETSAISALVEQTFLTITIGRTTRAQARQAQSQLQRAHANLAGVILLEL